MMARLPNLVIGGAPKCGTTSLYQWLADHDAVSGATTKETFYLMDPDAPIKNRTTCYWRDGLEGYARLFDETATSAAVRVEATTHYLYQRTAIEVLAAFRPQPHVVFLLRSPAQRVYSAFQYTKHNLGRMSDRLDFATYVDIVLTRPDALRCYVNHPGSARSLVREVEASRYAKYLRRWRERFSADRLHVVLFEELRARPREVVRRIAGAVDIDPAFYDGYEFYNALPTRPVRNLTVQRLALACAARLPKGRGYEALRRAYFAVQCRQERMSADDAAALARLRAHFRPYDDELGRDFALDLSVWEQST